MRVSAKADYALRAVLELAAAGEGPVKGAGVTARGRTNREGRAGISVKASRRGRLRVRIPGESASCAARTVRAV